jgi:hypothetical protein
MRLEIVCFHMRRTVASLNPWAARLGAHGPAFFFLGLVLAYDLIVEIEKIARSTTSNARFMEYAPSG